MRKKIILALISLCLCLAGSNAALSDIPEIDLSTFSLNDLNQLWLDISKEFTKHHKTDSNEERKILNIVKNDVENYYSESGITVDWAWYSWEYEYTRDKDFFTLSTHLNYKDKDNRSQHVNVASELYLADEEFHIYRISLNNEVIKQSNYALPKSLLIDTDNAIINKMTGINLSLLSTSELHEIEKLIDQEKEANHTPRNRDAAGKALEKVVEQLYADRGIERIEWPWFDYNYTCDWDCYTETTRISYNVNDKRHSDIPVYGEMFPADPGYEVVYLMIGEEEIFDHRNETNNENARLFLKTRQYESAVKAIQDEEYEKALTILEQIGDIKDSENLKALCQEHINQQNYNVAMALMEQGQYDEAAASFDRLIGYSDSKEKAELSREQKNSLVYQQATGLMEKEEYEKAIQLFDTIKTYQDSEDKLTECQNAITEKQYSSAKEKADTGNFSEAISILSSIGDYKDSIKLIEDYEEKIKNNTYQKAVNLYQDGAYEEAREAFLTLGEYKDSSQRAEEIRTIIASINREIQLETDEFFLFPKDKISLTPIVVKINDSAPDETIISYSSTDPKIASITKDGIITAGQNGDAIISCMATDNPYITRSITIHVVKSINRVTLNTNKIELSLPAQKGNDTCQLTIATDPADAYIKDGTWTTSNQSVATVNSEGLIQATGIGKAVITFTSRDTSKGKKSANCNVTVSQAVTGISLNATIGDIYIGKQVQLKASITPSNAGNKKINWISSNEKIATVNNKGIVKGISTGEAVITATSPDGPIAQYTATVKIAPVTLKISAKAKCIAKNHVGNKWTKEFYLNQDQFKGNGKIKVENGETFSVGCIITENDANPEDDGFTEIIEVTPEIMQKGTTIEKMVYVTENGGRYSGNSAEWKVTITIKP